MKQRLLLILTLCVTAISADESGIEQLMKGNSRFVRGDLLHPDRTRERREETALGQSPFAVIVTCSDSRVSPEIIFDEGIGDLFVVRLAGNIVGPLAEESIEFAVKALGASTILVMGHEKCGAVNAVLTGQDASIPDIAAYIAPSIRKTRQLEEAVKANALSVSADIAANPKFKPLIESNALKVYAGYYRLKSGAVELLPR